MKYIILSDIHANYTALEAVLDVAGLALPEAKFYFLGDLLGYGPYKHAHRCLEWLRDLDTEGLLHWVPGNHDAWAVARLGKMRTEGLVTLLIQSERLPQDQPEDWNWFKRYVQDAPSKLTERLSNDLLLVFAHGSPESRDAYLWPWMDSLLRRPFRTLAELTNVNAKILFCGHSHLPFLAEIKPNGGRSIEFHSIRYGEPITLDRGEYIVNPGSVGHPRDGDKRAAFAIFEPETRILTFHRVEYDTEPIIQALRKEQDRIQTLEALVKYEKSTEKRIPLQMKAEYRKRVKDAYKRLIHEIETGDGGKEMQYYLDRVYHRTQEGNLQAINAE